VGIEPARCMCAGRIQNIGKGDNVRVLFYAEDMKLFFPVSGFLDYLKIQSDLNKLSEWCNRYSLLLNVGKCTTITFARSRHPVEFSYLLGGTVLDRR
jgi:hypothetical protein